MILNLPVLMVDKLCFRTLKAESITPVAGSYSLHHSFDNTQAGNDQAGISLLDLKPDPGLQHGRSNCVMGTILRLLTAGMLPYE